MKMRNDEQKHARLLISLRDSAAAALFGLIRPNYIFMIILY